MWIELQITKFMVELEKKENCGRIFEEEKKW